MSMSIRQVCFDDGERYLLLVDEKGVPLYYPTLYVTAIVRGSSKATNTIRNTLQAIKMFYAWQNDCQQDFESIFAGGELLENHQIHALRDFMQQPLGAAAQNRGPVVSIAGRKRRPKTVSARVQYARLSVIASYLGFLAVKLQQGLSVRQKRIDLMVNTIKANRPKISNRSQKDREERYLDNNLLDQLDSVLDPGVKDVPERYYGIRVRNALMIIILRATGMRRGELLNLKVEDIDFSSNTLSVVRRPGSKSDSRLYQPVAKTRERKIPLDSLLVEKIYDYVLSYRNKVPGAKKHNYLFVTHQPGKTFGHPLSISGFNKFMGKVKKIDPAMDGVHAHAIRHTWNYMFSKQADEKNITPEREQQIRSYLMGWNPTSSTAATYNKRHIKEESNKAVLSLQDRYFNKKVEE